MPSKNHVKQLTKSTPGLWIKHHDFRLWTFIIELSDSINNEALKLLFLVNFQCLVVYYLKIHFDIYICENETCVKTTNS